MPTNLATNEGRVWRCLIAYLLIFRELPSLAYTTKHLDLTKADVRSAVQSLHEQGHIRRDSSGDLTIWSRRLPSGYDVK